jgi:hypothetical protein
MRPVSLLRWSAVLCCLMFPSGAGSAGEPEAGGVRASEEAQAAALHLDLANRTLVYPMAPRIAAPEKLKFVQVEIDRLVNPGVIPIIFEVRYRPEAGAEVLLGTFAPFPPNNPGTFIVPTQGRLRSGGAILLSMVPLRQVRTQDELQVDLAAISFRNG